MIFGLDFLGLPKYGQVAVDEFPDGFALGVFSSQFGDARPSVEAILRTGRCPRVRIHLLWRDDHTYTKNDIPETVKEAKKWISIINKYPNVEFHISYWCEHKAPHDLVTNVCGQVRAALPERVTMVNTPMTGGAIMPGMLNEVHGSNAQVPSAIYNFSFDGSACVDSDIPTMKGKMSKAQTFFFWEPRFNGRWETTDKTPIALRKGWPDSNLIDSVIYLSGFRGEISLPKKWLYKSHSENKGNGDPRAEKPVMISPIKAKEILLKTKNGQVVDTLRYYGTYADGRYRYYSQTWGYLTAEKARRIQGGPLCEVWVNKKKVGTLNPGFRLGEFK